MTLTSVTQFDTKRTLHSLSLSETDIISQVKDSFASASSLDATSIINDVLSHCESLPPATSLCCSILRECLRSHPYNCSIAFNKPESIYSILNYPEADEDVGSFVWELALVRSKLVMPNAALSLKLIRELSRRSGKSKPEEIQYSPLRKWLIKIWTDCPDAIPSHVVPIFLAMRWLGQGSSDMQSILSFLKTLQRKNTDEFSRRKFDLQLLSAFLRCAGSHEDSEFSQFSLVLLNPDILPFLLSSLIGDAQPRDVAKLWRRLVLPSPLIPCQWGLVLSGNLFAGSAYPLLPLLNAFARAAAAAERARGGNWEGLLEYFLRVVLAKLFSAETLRDGALAFSYLCKETVPLRSLPSLLVGDFSAAIRPSLQEILSLAITRSSAETVKDSDLPEIAAQLEVNASPVVAPELRIFVDLLPPGPLQSLGFLPSPAQGSLFAPTAPSLASAAWQRSGLCGIQNFNNTCYLASFLQALFLTSAFTAELFKKANGPLQEALRLVFARLLFSTHPHIEISDFMRVLPPSFRSGEQQDATESGRWLLDAVGEELAKIFSGKLVHKTECLTCHNITERIEPFVDLVLSVPREVETFGKRVTVQSLLLNFFAPEFLKGDNQYMCEKCSGKRDAKRWSEILQAPSHLILVLNRFSYDIKLGDFKKERTVVADCFSASVANLNFELYAGVMHEGETSTKGHYIALGRRSDGPKNWTLLDDSDATAVPEGEVDGRLSGAAVPRTAAYMLFYRSQNLPGTPAPQLPSAVRAEAEAIEAAAVHL